MSKPLREFLRSSEVDPVRAILLLYKSVWLFTLWTENFCTPNSPNRQWNFCLCMSYINTDRNLFSCKPKYILLNEKFVNLRSSPTQKKLFPLSWHAERAYSKSRPPTETGHQTIRGPPLIIWGVWSRFSQSELFVWTSSIRFYLEKLLSSCLLQGGSGIVALNLCIRPPDN